MEKTQRKDVFDLKVPPMEKVRIGFVGLGIRGIEAVKRYLYLPNNEIVALCDVHQPYVQQAQELLASQNKPEAKTYTEPGSWQELCRQENIDLIYISTPWEQHTEMAVYAMEQGKHVAVEVPIAMTVSECWQLVDTAEQTQRHCMMLENCCYDIFELAVLNMVRQGVFGTVVHAEGAYIHDLRKLNFQQNERDTLRGEWRIKYNLTHEGNPYPSHGLAPVCQAMNIHRGDAVDFLVSMSSAPFGMREYAAETFGNDSQQANYPYAMGDMNTTLIRTRLGKTILLQHDVTSPRPYSRLHLISGTKGFAQKYPTPTVSLDPEGMKPLEKNELEKLLQQHEHPFVKETAYLRTLLPDQKPMDIIMDYRLIYCLHHGLPLDINVYDSVVWSCLTELTEISVKNGCQPVKIPDFTRGKWNEITAQK
ncbi:MAG: Gfo/Idh/MocA family oxidoreductase [Capnocytophaga sp.]|nr:Gfo/Idh/MocA family oxidoreductase [Capnocytophaga sp.]